MKKEKSYLWRKLQGYFNARKEEFLTSLKERGTFIECCEKRGFLYALSIVSFEEELKLVVGLKNGQIVIHELNRANLRQAI